MHPKYLNARCHFCQEEKARVVQTILFVAGINTLLQTFFGTCLPVVMGGSYIFVAPTISIILAGRYSNEADPREVPHRSCALVITLVSVSLDTSFSDKLFYCSREEILADNAGNAGCSHHCIDNSDHTWFQWALAQCSQVGVIIFPANIFELLCIISYCSMLN